MYKPIFHHTPKHNFDSGPYKFSEMPEGFIVQDFKILAREVWPIFARCFAQCRASPPSGQMRRKRQTEKGLSQGSFSFCACNCLQDARVRMDCVAAFVGPAAQVHASGVQSSVETSYWKEG